MEREKAKKHKEHLFCLFTVLKVRCHVQCKCLCLSEREVPECCLRLHWSGSALSLPGFLKAQFETRIP